MSRSPRGFLALTLLLSVAAHRARGTPSSVAASSGPAAIEGRVLRDLASGPAAPVIVLLADQANLGAAPWIPDSSARGWFTYRTLRDHAARTQGPVLALLQRRGAPVQAFWAVNAIATVADAALVAELAARPDVVAVESNAENRWLGLLSDDAIADDLASTPAATAAQAETAGGGGTEWGGDNVRASDVWQLGYTGSGIVVASADTGVQWNHPALVRQYRGWNGIAAMHDHSWHDSIRGTGGNPCGNDAAAPCDDNDHGTHTTGTMVGDDALGNRIGVAPGARWIACRNMDRGNGTPARYIECMEFFLAPTDLGGANADPDLRPHIINNSWLCPGGEGCAPTTMEGIIENLRAAGIFFVASAGNDGPACSTVFDPPAIFEASFTVGAYDDTGRIADFSSRGPVTIDDSGRMKPNLSAPGVMVRSSVRNNGYAAFQGTSMAGPHVAGVVALLWSAHPELARAIGETRLTLTASAAPVIQMPATQYCGGLTSDFTPNHSFGQGSVDALRAVQW